ncbi:MAG: heme exporter protein CcmD [Robiginitomaculum sp.]|nr:MAG: heme exporter protein CcmD [Robiginitomaculum sp.]
MDLLPDFGRYSFYVWTCYGLSIAVILAFTVYTLRQNSKRPK